MEKQVQEIKEQFAAIVEQKWQRVRNCKKIVEHYGNYGLNEEALQEAKIEWVALFLAYQDIFGEVV